MAHPLPPDWAGDVLLLVQAADAEQVVASYPAARELGRMAPPDGWAIGRSFVALRVSPGYWAARVAPGGTRSLQGTSAPDAG